ncbi:hypothetical protein Pfo_019793 [Paulownia fortunei]|nr:hypothetical protein Pfo_019793 [Paulownia fortunei]
MKSEMKSLRSENSRIKQELASPDESSVSQLKKNSSSSDFETPSLTPRSLSNLTPTSLSIPALKFEENGDVDIQSPDYSLWESIFSDQLEGDFMICSPLRNMPSPQGSNYSYNYNYAQGMQGQSKGLSPLHRVFNSLNNRFMQVESLSRPAPESHRILIMKRTLIFDQASLQGSSQATQESGIYQMASTAPQPLSQQLQQERQQEAQQEHSRHMFIQEHDSGLQLVHLILSCAEAVSKEDYMLARSARLAATLTNKPSTSNLKPFNPFPPNNLEILKIYQILYQACPYIKFAHFTANQSIFEAIKGEEHVHIIDLDILQGYQWPTFMQALAARPGGAPFLRITGIGPSPKSLMETGRYLKPHMFNIRVGEALAVNSVNRLHWVPGNCLGNLLAVIRDQAPNIVTVVEQEASHNGPYFLGRILEALHYYSAILDSLDSTFPLDSTSRAKVEQHTFAPEIRNIVAHEGAERVMRHERLGKWRKLIEGKGFQGVPLCANAVTQSKILLGLYSCDDYSLKEDKGCLLLGWQDRAILHASSWRC